MREPKKTSISNEIKLFTGAKISSLQKQYLTDVSSARSKLAQYRQAISRSIGESPEVLSEVLNGIPEDLAGHHDELSAPEKAIYLTLLLYSLHQQSKSQPMHVFSSKDSPTGFGTAVKCLDTNRTTTESSETITPTQRRFKIILTSQDFDGAAYHLRGIIRQLRDHEIPLDYSTLAADLFLLQNPTYANRVRTRWLREFYQGTAIKNQ